jgi:hypothetical protein
MKRKEDPFDNVGQVSFSAREEENASFHLVPKKGLNCNFPHDFFALSGFFYSPYLPAGKMSIGTRARSQL